MKTFEFLFNSPRVLFGKGTSAQIPSLVEELGAKSVMLLSTPEQADIAKRVADILGDVAVSTFTGAYKLPNLLCARQMKQALTVWSR
ncbi:hypothetical protein LB505_012622 [Fusarium chuoi]|nr:hypothetical protein LB505_012622 [Fusarium chuoi]